MDGGVTALLVRLRAAGEDGLTLTQLHESVGRNAEAADMKGALTRLAKHGLAASRKVPPQPGGKKWVQRWMAVSNVTGGYEATKYDFDEFIAARDPEHCMRCGATVETYGSDGRPYCDAHAPGRVA